MALTRTNQCDGAVVANGEEHRWWIEWVPWIASVFASAIATIGAAVLWVFRDRMAIQKMLDDHDAKLTKLIDESEEWDGGHTHDNNIREANAQIGTLAVEMRTEVRHINERLNRWNIGWLDTRRDHQ